MQDTLGLRFAQVRTPERAPQRGALTMARKPDATFEVEVRIAFRCPWCGRRQTCEPRALNCRRLCPQCGGPYRLKTQVNSKGKATGKIWKRIWY